jgi:hypothetical protein
VLEKYNVNEEVIHGRIKSLNIWADGEQPYNEGWVKSNFEEAVISLIKQQFPPEFKNISSFISSFTEIRNYRIWTERKKKDADPFVNGWTYEVLVNEECVALLFSRRNHFNYAMIDYIIYPTLIKQLCKKLVEP